MKAKITFIICFILMVLLWLFLLTLHTQPVKQATPTYKPTLSPTARPTRKPVKKVSRSKRETYLGKYEITAYSHLESGGSWTASGKRVNPKYVAAPPEIPFGTKLRIEGIGVVEVQDRGGAVKGKVIDRYIADLGEVKKWGRRRRRVWVIR